MLLNTINSEVLIKSLADILCSDRKTIIKFFNEKAKDIINEHYNEFTIDHLNLDIIKKYCNCSKIQSIDEVVVNHIAPRKSNNSLKLEDIMTLPQVLLSDTELSRYLDKRGFVFEFVDNKIVCKHHGEFVDWNNLRQSNMIMRFGGQYSLYDFNVNGYLFATEWLLNSCRGWLGSPEILKSISSAFNDHSIADDYAERCQNYLISFMVGLENVDLECRDVSISAGEKNDLLLKYSINALAHWLTEEKHITDCYNPIIMLKRDYTVPKKDILAFHHLKVENNRVKVIAWEDK